MVAMASFFISTSTESDDTKNYGLQGFVETFMDSVKSLSEDNNTLIVTFNRHSEHFRIPQEHPKYAEIKEKLEKAQNNPQKIKVIAIIPSMTITNVLV